MKYLALYLVMSAAATVYVGIFAWVQWRLGEIMSGRWMVA